MDNNSYDLFRSLAANSSVDEKAVLLELLKETSVTTTYRNTAILGLKYSIAYFLASLVFCLESLILVTRPGTWKKPDFTSLFASSSEKNTSNNHFANLVNATDRNLNVLILESPLKRYRRKISDLPNLRIFWCRTPATELSALSRYFRCFASLLRTTIAVSRSRDIGTKLALMCFVRLIRGNSISTFLKSALVPKLIFTLSGNACTSMIEQETKGLIQTIHWLHGVGLGFTFESFSEHTLVNNEYDYHYYKSGIAGEPLFFPDSDLTFSTPRNKRDIRTVVIYSNLIHATNYFFDDYGINVEEELLDIVSSRFRDTRLVIRPHPASMKLLGNRAEDYAALVQSFGFELYSGSENLAPEESLYISTVSTSFIDLIACGKCVFMYEKFANTNSRFQDQVSSQIKFEDGASFDNALALIDSPDGLTSALNSLTVQSQEAVFEFLLMK